MANASLTVDGLADDAVADDSDALADDALVADQLANSELAQDAQVNAAGTHTRGRLRWGYFLLLNAIAGTIAAALFVAVLFADGLDPYLQGTYEWLLAHPGVTSAAAFSPLACSLLVGYGYAQRARRRKAAAAKRAKKADGDAA